jgi:hypothetical protein
MMKIIQTTDTNTLCNLIKFAVITLFYFGVLLSFVVNAEGTHSLSADLFKQVGDDAFWEVDVKCEGDFNSIVIRQKLKQDDWCVENRLLSCKKTKQEMAEEVCINIQTMAKPAPKPAKPVVTLQESQRLNRAAALSAEARKAAQDRQVARIKVEQEAKQKQERDRRALVSALNKEQIVLQEARVVLNQEILEVEQIEAKLESRAKEIEQQLQSLEN